MRIELMGDGKPAAEVRTPPVTMEELERRFRQLLFEVRLQFTEHLNAALRLNDSIVHDVKQIPHLEASLRRADQLLAQRISAIEKQLGIEQPSTSTEPASPGRDDWKLMQRPKKQRARPKIAPVPDWQREAAEAARRLEHELPALSSMVQLAKRFGVSYNRIVSLVSKGELRAVRDGSFVAIPRESVVDLVKRRGLPRPRSRFYGAAGMLP